MHAHGAVLRGQLFSVEQTAAIIRDHHTAGLEPAEVVMMDYVDKVARNPQSVTPEDIAALHAHGYSDEDILSITMVASARVYFSTVMDALGVELDEAMLSLEPEIRAAITDHR
ncbi:MAG: hypothetical protein Fur0018_24090 [Anaerolineales bacterium]